MTRQRSRRGQAALEFLSTYGFAFLLILVMIGALSYFGVLNPQRLIPDRCIATSEFSCYDDVARVGTGTGTFTLLLFNNLGTQVTIGGTQVTVPEFASTASGCTVVPTTITSGGRFNITCTNLNIPTGSMAVGQKIKLAYTFNYTEPGKIPKSSGGEVLTTVQP